MAYLVRVNKLSPAALFVVVFSFFVQPVREVSCLSCALFFRGGSVPAEAKDDIMWVRVLSRVCTPYVVFGMGLLVVRLAIHKNPLSDS